VMKAIAYRKGYKYQLAYDYEVKTGIYLLDDIDTEYISLSKGGLVKISEGYAWDGPSGPTIDTPNFMRGSLIHDALYQLLRNRLLPQSYRERADNLLHQVCLEDGMSAIRAYYVWKFVNMFAEDAASPEKIKKIIWAPRKPE